MTIRRKGRSLDSKLVAYSAMAGAALAGGQAQAAECGAGVEIGTVCYTDIEDHIVYENEVFPIDLDGNGDPELVVGLAFHSGWVYYWSYFFSDRTAWVAADTVSDRLDSVLAGFSSEIRGPDASLPGALVSGDTAGAPLFGSWSPIGAAWKVLGYRWYVSMPSATHFGGNFYCKGIRYVGLSIDLGDGEDHFGWVRLVVAPTSQRVVIRDYAFQMVPAEPCPTDPVTIFADGFDDGTSDAWSATVP